MGDRNTKFFHLSTLERRRRNRILALKNYDNCWIHDTEALKAMVQDFFVNLYCEPSANTVFIVHGGYPSIEVNDWDFIYHELTPEEIKDTLFNMGSLKAPSPDGLHALFYQSQWEVVGNSICELVFSIFKDPLLIGSINQTFISLIPKVEKPKHVKQFRPIGLCNVIYKVVTKLLANRLKRIMAKVIAPT